MVAIRIAAATALACLSALPAVAQTATPSAGANGPVPEKTAPGTAPATNLDRQSGSLSTKLGDTNGVIKPSGDVDPAMRKGTPQTGTMPVIKPGQTGEGVAK